MGHQLCYFLSACDGHVAYPFVMVPGGAMQAKKMQLPIVTSKFSKKSLQHIFCHAMRFSSDESLLAVIIDTF